VGPAKTHAWEAFLEMAQTMNQYEAMFLLGPIGSAEPEKSLNLCRGVIEHHNGKVIVIKKWDERKLSFEIEGQKRGTYLIAYFTAPGSAITAIERDVKLSEEILRVLITTADHLNESEMNSVEPQPIQPREERSSYDRPPMGMDLDIPRPVRANYDRGSRPSKREEMADIGEKE
jgi:small subunit ribosomal protein S6